MISYHLRSCTILVSSAVREKVREPISHSRLTRILPRSNAMKKKSKDSSKQPSRQELLKHAFKMRDEGHRPIRSVRKSWNKKWFQQPGESS